MPFTEICWQRARRHDVAHKSVGLVADDDMSRLGDRLEPRREINLGTDGGVVHAVDAAEIADVAEAGVDAHAHAERLFRTRATPFDIELGQPALHLRRHIEAGPGVLHGALGLGVAEEDHQGITDEFIDGAAMLEGDRRHLREILVEEERDLPPAAGAPWWR